MDRDRGWPPVTRQSFNALSAPKGVLIVGGPEEVVEKLLRQNKALGGVDMFAFQMDNAGLSHQKLLQATELKWTKVMPLIKLSL